MSMAQICGTAPGGLGRRAVAAATRSPLAVVPAGVVPNYGCRLRNDNGRYGFHASKNRAPLCRSMRWSLQSSIIKCHNQTAVH